MLPNNYTPTIYRTSRLRNKLHTTQLTEDTVNVLNNRNCRFSGLIDEDLKTELLEGSTALLTNSFKQKLTHKQCIERDSAYLPKRRVFTIKNCSTVPKLSESLRFNQKQSLVEQENSLHVKLAQLEQQKILDKALDCYHQNKDADLTIFELRTQNEFDFANRIHNFDFEQNAKSDSKVYDEKLSILQQQNKEHLEESLQRTYFNKAVKDIQKEQVYDSIASAALNLQPLEYISDDSNSLKNDWVIISQVDQRNQTQHMPNNLNQEIIRSFKGNQQEQKHSVLKISQESQHAYSFKHPMDDWPCLAVSGRFGTLNMKKINDDIMSQDSISLLKERNHYDLYNSMFKPFIQGGTKQLIIHQKAELLTNTQVQQNNYQKFNSCRYDSLGREINGMGRMGLLRTKSFCIRKLQ